MCDKPALSIYLAEPRGFCAGVDRAIDIVDRALQKYGAPVYVRHEIVHNAFVVDGLKAKGAVFVDELSDVPDGVPVGVLGAWSREIRTRRSQGPRTPLHRRHLPAGQ